MSSADRLKASQLVRRNAIYHYGSSRQTKNAVCCCRLCYFIYRFVMDVTRCTAAIGLFSHSSPRPCVVCVWAWGRWWQNVGRCIMGNIHTSFSTVQQLVSLVRQVGSCWRNGKLICTQSPFTANIAKQTFDSSGSQLHPCVDYRKKNKNKKNPANIPPSCFRSVPLM